MATASTKITALSVFGIIVSIYALRVETMIENDDDYEAMCDLAEHVQCTHVLGSRWGRGFGLIGFILGEDSVFNQPNSIAGIVFYLIILALNFSGSWSATRTMFILAVGSNLMTIYLASILYFVLYDFCVVCATIYVINGGLLYVSWKKKNSLFKKID